MFPAQQNYFCSHVPFIFWLVVPCSSEINDIISLFPITFGGLIKNDEFMPKQIETA